MLRFVVLYHELPADAARASHWDLMLEDGEILLAWALERPPDEEGEIPAIELPPHRPRYLSYEGPLSDERGRVARWDAGHYTWLTREPANLSLRVNGARLSGVLTLAREAAAAGAQRWIVMFKAE